MSGLMSYYLGFDSFPAPFTEEEIRIAAQTGKAAKLANLLAETPDDSRRRKETARSLIRKIFAIAIWHLGDEEARKVWDQVTKKRRGPRSGPRKPDQDAKLLHLFSDACERKPDRVPALPREMGEFLNEEFPNQFGASALAIEKKLRRLLTERKEVILAMNEVELAVRAVIGSRSRQSAGHLY